MAPPRGRQPDTRDPGRPDGGGATAADGACGTLPGVQPPPQERVLAALPLVARYGLQPLPADDLLAARELTSPTQLAELLAAHRQLYPGASPAVVATVWWYLASAVLVGPPAAGALVGVPLSAALDDLEVVFGPAGMVSAAASVALGPSDPGPDLGETLRAVIDALCAVAGLRPRPLWAIAVDSLANRLLTFGRARHEVDRATVLAHQLTTSSGAPVPAPRVVDVDGARFVVRGSCCALYRTPGGELCTSCPRRTADDRAARLQRTAPDFR